MCSRSSVGVSGCSEAWSPCLSMPSALEVSCHHHLSRVALLVGHLLASFRAELGTGSSK